MEVGKNTSPIIRALQYLNKRTRGEVRVHISKNIFEKDSMDYALKLFEYFKMTQSTDRSSVLIYLNRHKQAYAVVADEGIHRKLGQKYWDELSKNLKEDLQSTYFENALAMAIHSLGVTLEKHYPIEN